MAGSQVCHRHSSSSSTSTSDMWPFSCIKSNKTGSPRSGIPLGVRTPSAPFLLHRGFHLKQARTHCSPLRLPLLSSFMSRFGEECDWKQSGGQGHHPPKVQAHLRLLCPSFRRCYSLACSRPTSHHSSLSFAPQPAPRRPARSGGCLAGRREVKSNRGSNPWSC